MKAEYLLRFFNRNPQTKSDWREDTKSIDVFIGVMAETIQNSTRAGVLLALNDAFGDKKQ